MARKRYLCLHGHFYQPPRENPWIEEIEVQDTAAPFHDWNARITAECYGPNAAARILAGDRRIADVVNNYRLLSFNFGPTLLSWLERANPAVYEAILEADRLSASDRNGHGNALAQAYNHAILPLCSPRDQRTQIEWGLADFRRRFGRDAEGIWLPETAVDLPTLEHVAAAGLRFTILSPYQAKAVRGPEAKAFEDVSGGRVDPSRPYLVKLASGRTVTVFFYDGPIAKALAFEGGLSSPDELLRRLEGGFAASRSHVELLNVAVDGETFGHHKKQGDEVVAGALTRVGARGITLTNYAAFLDEHPATWEAQLVEPSSWSCAHGVERWRSDCGCSASGQPGWKQHWRKPLRDALDGLRDGLASHFEKNGAKLLRDPWAARDAYVEVILERTAANVARFLARHERAPGLLSEPGHRADALRLLEMQRNAMLMYTSCGWFFSEVSGIETVQVLRYAARTAQLCRDSNGPDLEPAFLGALSEAPSNLPSLGNAARVYEREVRPSVATLQKIVAHHAIAHLFDEAPTGETRVFCYRLEPRNYRRASAGPATLATGRVRVESELSGASLDAAFAVLHFGGQDFRCVIQAAPEPAALARAEEELFAKFARFSLTDVVRAMDAHYPGHEFTLRDLFLDERRALARMLLRDTMARYERDYQRIFEENRGLMRFLVELDIPAPEPLRAAAGLALGNELRSVIDGLSTGALAPSAAHGRIVHVCNEAKAIAVRLETDASKRVLERLVREGVRRLVETARRETAREVVEVLELADAMGVRLDLWAAQNGFWSALPALAGALERELLARLGEKLFFDRRALAARLEASAGEPALAAAAG